MLERPRATTMFGGLVSRRIAQRIPHNRLDSLATSGPTGGTRGSHVDFNL